MTGVGFHTDWRLPDSVPLPDITKKRVQLGGVMAKLPNTDEEVAFILWIEGQKIEWLEGYTYGDKEWPETIDFLEAYFFDSDKQERHTDVERRVTELSEWL